MRPAGSVTRSRFSHCMNALLWRIVIPSGSLISVSSLPLVKARAPIYYRLSGNTTPVRAWQPINARIDLCQTLWEIDTPEILTIHERLLTNGRHTLRPCDPCQVVTFHKRFGTDGCHARGNGHLPAGTIVFFQHAFFDQKRWFIVFPWRTSCGAFRICMNNQQCRLEFTANCS